MTLPALPELPARVREAIDLVMTQHRGGYRLESALADLEIAIREGLGEAQGELARCTHCDQKPAILCWFCAKDSLEEIRRRAEKAEAALAECNDK